MRCSHEVAITGHTSLSLSTNVDFLGPGQMTCLIRWQGAANERVGAMDLPLILMWARISSLDAWTFLQSSPRSIRTQGCREYVIPAYRLEEASYPLIRVQERFG